jgi:hypothetical protein
MASEGAMRKVVAASLLAVTLLLILAAPSDAHGRRGPRTRVFVGLGVGPAFWYHPFPYWYYPYYPYYYPPPYYVYTPPPVVVQEPPVYVQQQPAPAAPAEGYWHYCASARAYYPQVQTCPEAWIKVPPRQE